MIERCVAMFWKLGMLIALRDMRRQYTTLPNTSQSPLALNQSARRASPEGALGWHSTKQESYSSLIIEDVTKFIYVASALQHF